MWRGGQWKEMGGERVTGWETLTKHIIYTFVKAAAKPVLFN